MPKRAASTKAGGKAKKIKDPNAPKRPLSAYFIWLQEFRERMRVEKPKLVKNVKEFGKAAGEEWRTLDDSEKEPYQEKHLELKAAYEKAMRNYVPPVGMSSGKAKKQKDPNAPKKPSTAFFLFMADNRERIKAENPDITPAQVGKVLGAEWRELDPKDKAEYEATYETNLEQWRKDKLAYDKGQQSSRATEDSESEEETDSE